MQTEAGTQESPDQPDDSTNLDSPDLWVKCRAAKQRLYAETNFSVRYRASSSPLAIGLLEPDRTGADMSPDESPGREPERSSLEWDLPVVASVKLPAVNPARWSAVVVVPPSSASQPEAQEPSGESQPDETPNLPPPQPQIRVKVAQHSAALYIAPHLRGPSQQPLRAPQRYRTSRPYRPIPVRAPSKQPQVSSHIQPTFFKAHLVAPLPNPSRLKEEITDTSLCSPSPSQSPETKQESSPHKTETDTEKTTEVKMSDSGSDEIMLVRGNRFRSKQQQEPPVEAESSRRPEERAARRRSTSRKPPNLQLDSSSPSEQQDNSPKGKAPTQTQEEVREELRRLGGEIVQRAHLNRFKNFDNDDANPEALATCRGGPGTDQNSEFYQLMAQRRRVEPIVVVVEEPNPSPSAEHSGDAEERTRRNSMDARERHVAQWDAYLRSPHIYPIVENGELHLSRTPTAEHRHIEEQMARLGLDPTNAQVDKDMPRPDNKWSDAFYADWEYRPRVYSNFEAFRDWFRRWLDTTIQICCYADIYHDAFFDGTAHPDGVRVMYIPDLENVETVLDPSDEMTKLHAHETSEGYSYNFVQHKRKTEQDAKLRREMNRRAHLEALRIPPQSSSKSPKANIYLRPAELEDSRSILQIMNWYAHESTLSTDVRSLETGDVRQRIESCQENRMPFIVAVERKTGRARDNQPENVVGYALAKDTVGIETSGRFVAELHVFVRDGSKRLGIGRCLMDKLLEVCDGTYNPEFGYFFNAAFDDQPKFRPGGCRKFNRLLFAVGYEPDKRSELKWLMDWLLEKYGFEEQAVLKGARVKFEHFNDVSYLVRTIGSSRNNRFEY